MAKRKMLFVAILCISSCLFVACKKEGICDYCNSEGNVKRFSYEEDASYYELCDECYERAEKDEIDLGSL